MNAVKFSAPSHAITAILYEDGPEADRAMRRIYVCLTARGVFVAGFVQINEAQPGRSRCDMILHEMASGEEICISEDRGPHARGCKLNLPEMVRAEGLLTAALQRGPDLLIVNKFGKMEALGGGFRPQITSAVEAGVPVLIAVPRRNLEAWHAFAGGLSNDVSVEALAQDGAALCAGLGFANVGAEALAVAHSTETRDPA